MKEIEALLGSDLELLGLEDMGLREEIPEDHETLEENASQKAWYVYNKFKISCFVAPIYLDKIRIEIDIGIVTFNIPHQSRHKIGYTK